MLNSIQDGIDNPTPVSINIAATPAPVACTECRARHQRCDAETPICNRCQREQRECHYVQSRRGYKGPRKRPRLESSGSVADCHPSGRTESCSAEQKTAANAGTFISAAKPQMLQILTPSVTTPPGSLYDEGCYTQTLAEVTLPRGCLDAQTMIGKFSGLNGIADDPPDRSRSLALVDFKKMAFEQSLRAYYRYFHDGHPILLPRKLLFSTLFEQYPFYLKNVIQFIGSHYESSASTETVSATIGHELLNETARDGYMVQALLLYAIALLARDEQTRARQILSSAIQIALELGMHRKGFAVDHSCGSRHMAECWRRTVWELYVVDGMLSFHMHAQDRLFNEDIEAFLPRDEITESDTMVSSFADYIFNI